MTEGAAKPYIISTPRAELQKLKEWGEWARQHGLLDQYLAALRTINYRLSYEPLEWGEARYSLDELKLEMRFGSFDMLHVGYGVHQERRIVFVKRFQFRSDYPHGTPPVST
jgi:hypothetical protein